ncbi:hypothetical protein B296_00022157 [Ensete ventricosum]|uniref:Uncharacterized protein n=1 Tax=Ensete ventricosum TaxID=4639 RepID=A0A427AUV1_ENSVE|nr:hypothetical protein B296_00022157 [Ensete ventricosum]
MVLWTSSILWFIRRSCALRESVEFEESVSGSGKLWTDVPGVGVGRLPRDIGDNCSKHYSYGLDLVGGFTSSNKGRGGGGCEAPQRSVESPEGRLPPGCRELSVLATSGPPSSAKILLDDPSCLRSQHDVVRSARAGAAQQDLELGEDMRGLLGWEVFWSSRDFSLVPWSDICKKRPSLGGGPPNEVPPMAKLVL